MRNQDPKSRGRDSTRGNHYRRGRAKTRGNFALAKLRELCGEVRPELAKQDGFARWLGVKTRSLVAYENGERPMPRHFRAIVAAKAGVWPRCLVEDTTQMHRRMVNGEVRLEPIATLPAKMAKETRQMYAKLSDADLRERVQRSDDWADAELTRRVAGLRDVAMRPYSLAECRRVLTIGVGWSKEDLQERAAIELLAVGADTAEFQRRAAVFLDVAHRRGLFVGVHLALEDALAEVAREFGLAADFEAALQPKPLPSRSA